MTTPANTAKRCFEENVRLFAPSSTAPEKYNLYNGLARLAEAIEHLEADISDLRNRVRRLEQS